MATVRTLQTQTMQDTHNGLKSAMKAVTHEADPLQYDPGASVDFELDARTSQWHGESAVQAGRLWCLPTCIATKVPASCAEKVPPTCVVGPWACCSWDRPLVISIEILKLVVWGDGLLSMPSERRVLDPRTWFRWRPAVEVIGISPAVMTTDGVPVNGGCASCSFGAKEQQAAWKDFRFTTKKKEEVAVNARGSLRFRIFRRYENTLVHEGTRHSEAIFVSSLHMWHDFFSQSCPAALTRPVFEEGGEGKNKYQRHIGDITVAVQVGGPARYSERRADSPSKLYSASPSKMGSAASPSKMGSSASPSKMMSSSA